MLGCIQHQLNDQKRFICAGWRRLVDVRRLQNVPVDIECPVEDADVVDHSCRLSCHVHEREQRWLVLSRSGGQLHSDHQHPAYYLTSDEVDTDGAF